MSDHRHRIPVESFAVSVYVARRNGDQPLWLLMRRTEQGGGFGGIWQQVTGCLEAGEAPEQAALREVGEETGLKVVELYSADAIETFYEPGSRSIWMNPVFLAIVSDGDVELSAEHDRFEWLDTQQATDRVPFWQQRNNIELIRREFFEKTPCKWLKLFAREASQ
ncbi:MAG: NUDIX hydrolase [Planctomycetota bacterium]